MLVCSSVPLFRRLYYFFVATWCTCFPINPTRVFFFFLFSSTSGTLRNRGRRFPSKIVLACLERRDMFTFPTRGCNSFPESWFASPLKYLRFFPLLVSRPPLAVIGRVPERGVRSAQGRYLSHSHPSWTFRHPPTILLMLHQRYTQAVRTYFRFPRFTFSPPGRGSFQCTFLTGASSPFPGGRIFTAT